MTAQDIKAPTIAELLNENTEKVIEIKGVPKKQTNEQGDLFYWYGSIVPTKAEIYRFQNDKVVWISIDMDKENIILSDVVQSLGEPEFSVKRYAETDDSLRTRAVAWPSQGKAVLVNGNDIYSKVVRFEVFEPESVAEYQANWGKAYASNEAVNLLVTSAPQLQQAVSQEKQPFTVSKQRLVVEIVGAMLLIVVFLLVFRKALDTLAKRH